MDEDDAAVMRQLLSYEEGTAGGLMTPVIIILGPTATVAEALDQLEWPDVAGTIAGDDTVLIICRSTEGRERVLKKLRAYLRTA